MSVTYYVALPNVPVLSQFRNRAVSLGIGTGAALAKACRLTG